MYLNTMARYLGDAEPATIATVRKRCTPRWQTYKVAHPGQRHAWRLFLAANPSCRRPMPPVKAGLGTIMACNDANTGLLINCWDAALKKGLGNLGTAIDQAQLSRLSQAYQRWTHPQRLAGLGSWVSKSGGGMRWQPRLGDTALETQDAFDESSWLTSAPPGPTGQVPLQVVPSYVPPPDISAIIAQQTPSKIPSSLINFSPAIPTVTAQTLIAAAQLPNAPANVKAAAAQVSAGGLGASSLGSIFTGSAIGGIPNYLLIGGGLVLVLMFAGRGRR